MSIFIQQQTFWLISVRKVLGSEQKGAETSYIRRISFEHSQMSWGLNILPW
jgi:hypothetical protein